ncbi:MAG: hypothetical protein ACREFE_05545 [Limisphaerales bacterium]
MKLPLRYLIVQSLSLFNDSTVQRFNGLAIIFSALFFSTFARAEFSLPNIISARSVSGQFLIAGSPEKSPLFQSPRVINDNSFVRLEPALLAVSAERIKELLGRELDFDSMARWRGQIFLALHPARSLDEDVTIVSQPSGGDWSYQVRLPDVLSRERFTRAMTGVLLLEFANRKADGRAAEIPDWLTDGLSQELLAADSMEIILSEPDKMVNGLPVTRMSANERGLDSLADARRALKNVKALTFEQLSWPTRAQLSGDDDGVYRASAQLFVKCLLEMPNGPAQLRVMLEMLPRYYNWQTAFQKAFAKNFPRPLNLEKWWALQVVNFAARDHGPVWTPTVSREKLNEILSVPVEMRAASNSLPSHAEISLQAVIRDFDSTRRSRILQTKLRDIQLAQLQMSPQLSALAAGYRRVLADYLGENKSRFIPRWTKHAARWLRKAGVGDTVKKLDALDLQRRTIEAAIKPEFQTP